MQEISLTTSKKMSKMSKEIQIRDIGTQLSTLLYGEGKKLTSGPNGILGTAQNILIKQNDLLNKTILVTIPSDCESYPMYSKVQNMIAHGRKHKIDIKVV